MSDSNDEKALIASLDALPLAELQGLSEKHFDAEGDAERAPKFGSRFIIAKTLNDSQMFEVDGEKVDKIRGVIAEFQNTKTWYEKPLGSGNAGGHRPDCWSVDGIKPHSNVHPAMVQNDKCATCKKNQFYPDPDPKKAGKKKKDCRDTLTLYLWHPAYDLPILYRASTMNRKAVSDFLRLIAEKKIAKEMLVVELTLFKDSQSADVVFSGLKISVIGSLSYVQKYYSSKGENLTNDQIAMKIVEFKSQFAEVIDTEGAVVADSSDEVQASTAPAASTPKANAATAAAIAATKTPAAAATPPKTTIAVPPVTKPAAAPATATPPADAGDPPF